MGTSIRFLWLGVVDGSTSLSRDVHSLHSHLCLLLHQEPASIKRPRSHRPTLTCNSNNNNNRQPANLSPSSRLQNLTNLPRTFHNQTHTHKPTPSQIHSKCAAVLRRPRSTTRVPTRTSSSTSTPRKTTTSGWPTSRPLSPRSFRASRCSSPTATAPRAATRRRPRPRSRTSSAPATPRMPLSRFWRRVPCRSLRYVFFPFGLTCGLCKKIKKIKKDVVC